MRLILTILLIGLFKADAQMVINASAPYRSFAVSSNLILDDYTGAAAAYSLRKLDKDYTGAAIRVRKDTTGQPEQDVFFTAAGDLDTAALKSFLNARSGFVTTWYDQSGNSRNSIQATAANQPRIANLGVIQRKSGKIGILFDGSNDLLDGTDISIVLNNITGFCVFAANNTSALQFVFNVSLNPQRYCIPVVSSGRFYYGFNTSNTAIDVATANTNLNIFSGLADNTNAFARLNGTNSTTIPSSTNAPSGVNRIGGFAVANSPFNGYVSECILYTSYQSIYADIETNINTYWSIY